MDLEQTPAAVPMGGRTASRIAWSLRASTLAPVVCALVLSIFNRYDPQKLL